MATRMQLHDNGWHHLTLTYHKTLIFQPVIILKVRHTFRTQFCKQWSEIFDSASRSYNTSTTCNVNFDLKQIINEPIYLSRSFKIFWIFLCITWKSQSFREAFFISAEVAIFTVFIMWFTWENVMNTEDTKVRNQKMNKNPEEWITFLNSKRMRNKRRIWKERHRHYKYPG